MPSWVISAYPHSWPGGGLGAGVTMGDLRATKSRWWLLVSNIFVCSPRSLGKFIQFDLGIFFRWVGEKPPTRSVV